MPGSSSLDVIINVLNVDVNYKQLPKPVVTDTRQTSCHEIHLEQGKRVAAVVRIVFITTWSDMLPYPYPAPAPASFTVHHGANALAIYTEYETGAPASRENYEASAPASPTEHYARAPAISIVFEVFAPANFIKY